MPKKDAVQEAPQEAVQDDFTNAYVLLLNPVVGRKGEAGGFKPLGTWFFSVPGSNVLGGYFYPVRVKSTSGEWIDLTQWQPLDELEEAVRVILSDLDNLPPYAEAGSLGTTKNACKVMSVWIDVPSANLFS